MGRALPLYVMFILSAVGQKQTNCREPKIGVVRCWSNSGQTWARLDCPLSANSGLMNCSKQHLYSITSSARPISVLGTLMPNAFAVLRLMSSSTFVTCWTGRSAGFSPLRMRPV
jgi:hypothetical protein